MRALVVVVGVDVYGKVLVKVFELLRVHLVAEPARNLAVLDAAELVVLDPEVALQDLRGGGEPQQRRVSSPETLAMLSIVAGENIGRCGDGQSSTGGCRRQSFLEKRSPA